MGLNKKQFNSLSFKFIWTFIKDHIVKCICATWKSHTNQYSHPSATPHPQKEKKGNAKGTFFSWSLKQDNWPYEFCDDSFQAIIPLGVNTLPIHTSHSMPQTYNALVLKECDNTLRMVTLLEIWTIK